MKELQNIQENAPISLKEREFEFEKYKAKVALFKWLIVSVALVLMTTIIDYGFRDRSAGLKEIDQYDRYVTELIILNKEPGQRRMLAQFFAFVTPSEKLKEGWRNYFDEVDKEYQAYIIPILKNDSIVRKKYNMIVAGPDSISLSQTKQLKELKEQIESNNKIINPEIKIPVRNIK